MDHPKPSVYLTVNTLISIFGCTATLAVGAADFVFGPTEDPRSQFIGALCTLPTMVFFVIVQYLAVFRRSTRAAAIATCLLFFWGGMYTVMAITISVHLVYEEGLAPVLLVPVMILAFSLYLLLSAILNLRWWRRLAVGNQ